VIEDDGVVEGWQLGGHVAELWSWREGWAYVVGISGLYRGSESDVNMIAYGVDG